MRRVDSQVDRKVADALVAPGNTVSLVLDFLHNSRKLHELLSLGVQELPILHWTVNQLENERSPGDDARSSGQEIPATYMVSSCLLSDGSV